MDVRMDQIITEFFKRPMINFVIYNIIFPYIETEDHLDRYRIIINYYSSDLSNKMILYE